MLRQYVWVDKSNINYSQFKFRKSYAKAAGPHEYPVDRFNILQGELGIPTHVVFKKPPAYDLNSITPDFEERYYSIIPQIADNVFKTAGDRTIVVAYSGGIDSTCVLVALMQHPSYAEKLAAGKFKVALTSLSIQEYPHFFFKFILPNIPITFMSYDTFMNDPDVLLVTGDQGDFVMSCSDSFGLYAVDPRMDLRQPWEYLVKIYLGMEGLEDYVYMCLQAMKQFPGELKYVSQFFWWINQCYVAQVELIRPFIWTNFSDYTEIGTQNKVFRFFYDDLMIAFSYEYMCVDPKFHYHNDTKTWPKTFIKNFTKDEAYMSKEKVFSQSYSLRTLPKTRIFLEDGVIKSELSNKVIEV